MSFKPQLPRNMELTDAGIPRHATELGIRSPEDL